MGSPVNILVLLSALAATSAALSCVECSSSSSTCTGSSVTCTSGYMCGSEYTETVAGGSTSVSLTRSCVASSQCSFTASLTTSQGKIRMATSCCNNDNCTAALPTLPAQSTNSNGVTCRSCVSADSTWCYTPDTIQCTGNETMCILQTTQITGLLSTAVRGCSTKSLCDLGSQSTSVEGTAIKVQFICTSGGIRVHNVLLTPAIVCLLLLKVFF
ncbi:hypothetical protein GDO81_025610 [Engystomops pustulosus]|uniref:Phospholipase A2 inhibitor and Ly6/PLAUR domain-containing protein-like n=1 Tax=Engystomops pustulosus TaxID=76066 RepID=A0AAV6ZGI7_ENGPU|nr:hypothetical protein GDO81_025610 [Engystomops pustulosus]